MSGDGDDNDKTYEASAHKLQEARKKGEIAKSTDLLTAAAYLGLLLAFGSVGTGSLIQLGTTLMVLVDQAASLAPMIFEGAPTAPLAGIMINVAWATAPFFALPTLFVLAVLFATRGIVFAPSKLSPKLSRISLISNAKNKFGRSGLFEFAKSFTKLILFSACLAVFLRSRLSEMIAVLQSNPQIALALLAELFVAFLTVVTVVALLLGMIDALWQYFEHLRKNMMSRKELTDEAKDSDGDPHMKQQRRRRAQEIASVQMMVDVPSADVIIVNPTHYAVALKWSRLPGEAPICVAKGIDEIALRIRQIATESHVPIHSDPPTARAVFATTDIGQQIAPDHFGAVAAAIRFSEAMRKRQRGSL